MVRPGLLVPDEVFAMHEEEIEVAFAAGLRTDAKTCVHMISSYLSLIISELARDVKSIIYCFEFQVIHDSCIMHAEHFQFQKPVHAHVIII